MSLNKWGFHDGATCPKKNLTLCYVQNPKGFFEVREGYSEIWWPNIDLCILSSTYFFRVFIFQHPFCPDARAP